MCLCCLSFRLSLVLGPPFATIKQQAAGSRQLAASSHNSNSLLSSTAKFVLCIFYGIQFEAATCSVPELLFQQEFQSEYVTICAEYLHFRFYLLYSLDSLEFKLISALNYCQVPLGKVLEQSLFT